MPLKLSIEYFPATDLFEATLENHARFTFSRSDISGKLENNLTLYRRAVVRQLEGGELESFPKSKEQERKELADLVAGKPVQVVGVKKKLTKLNLDDLDIDL